MADLMGTVKVKSVDASGVNQQAIDSYGSSQVNLRDASGAVLGTSGNPVYTDTTLLSSTAIIGTVDINQSGANNGVQVVSGPGTSSGNPLFVSTTTGASGTPVYYYTTFRALQMVHLKLQLQHLLLSGKKGYLANVYCSSQVAASFKVQTVDTS